MPTKIKITKEMIVDAAFEITREKGINEVSNREIAKKLNSSIRPIYYQFKNSKELNEALMKKIGKYFYVFLLNGIDYKIPPYKQIGINYVKFAKEEPNLFKILFMSNYNQTVEKFVFEDEDFKEVADMIKISTKLSDEDLKGFHVQMWIFTHGISCLCATNTIDFSNDNINDLLSRGFQAFMLLEENPDNKWNMNIKENREKWEKENEKFN